MLSVLCDMRLATGKSRLQLIPVAVIGMEVDGRVVNARPDPTSDEML